ncbi:MAG: tRNA pseudouridine(38-40) synthase TruA [Synergistaceae bacterium]|jgi:tRNA pseudouridine38-40 synthase|nr:tRNA pseudouridine(38-40) synthase TruA [Synergistaceae bacterium]
MLPAEDDGALNYALEVSYDGGYFSGWQSQPDGSGVQDALERALYALGESGDQGASRLPHRVDGAGRTDAGVHARAQIASVRLLKQWVPRRLVPALNARLPEAVSVMRAALAPPGFHARRSAVLREYRYFIWNSSVCYPHIRRYVLWQPGTSYDWKRAAHAAGAFVGRHDFRAFCRTRDVPGSTVRDVFRSSLHARGNLIVFRVMANAYLANMVRIMTGCLMEIARGRFDEARLSHLLSGGAVRAENAATPPPSGLFLWKVGYPDVIEWDAPSRPITAALRNR